MVCGDYKMYQYLRCELGIVCFQTVIVILALFTYHSYEDLYSVQWYFQPNLLQECCKKIEDIANENILRYIEDRKNMQKHNLKVGKLQKTENDLGVFYL